MAARKLEVQVAALEAAGPEAGVAYCWYSRIDREGFVTDSAGTPEHEGHVLDRFFDGNFVGNGSSILARAAAVRAAGGYEPALRAAGAQGCEDWLFFSLLAEHHRFVCVREHLVGYRFTPAAMSGDFAQMMRSYRLVRERIAARHPEAAARLDAAGRDLAAYLCHLGLQHGRFGRVARMLGELPADWRWPTLGRALRPLRPGRAALRALLRPPAPRRHWDDCEGSWPSPPGGP